MAGEVGIQTFGQLINFGGSIQFSAKNSPLCKAPKPLEDIGPTLIANIKQTTKNK